MMQRWTAQRWGPVAPRCRRQVRGPEM